MTITELAIKRPTLIVVIFSFLGVLGIFGFSQLKYDLMPKMSPPVLIITTIYPGGSPYEVETSITRTIEDAVSGLDGISTIRSSSYEGRSFIYVEFNMDVDINLALQDATRKINEIINIFPTGTKAPIISKISFDEIPVLRMAVYSTMKSTELYQFVKDKVTPRFTRIDGVGNVGLTGGEQREIKVAINYQKLRSYGLSLAQVTNTVKMANIELPAGDIKDVDDQFTVRVTGKFKSIEEMRNLIIGRSKTGGDIHLSDIAEARDGIKEITTVNRLNGNTSVGITIQKQSGGNTVEVSKIARQEIAQLEKDYKDKGLKFEIAQDASTFIIQAANAVKEDLGLAILLVALVMFIFLHSIRNSLIVMVAIPSSLISTFFLMYIFGFTLNMMTLLAMSLVIGILVDDSIVVIENIHRHLEMGERKRDAALHGRNEIGFAALSITFVDVVVFLPLALITGMIGNLLREYSLVVVFSTLMSLFVSFTITPLLASRFSKLEHKTNGSIMSAFGKIIERFLNKISEYYVRILRWSLRHKPIVLIGTLLIFLSSLMLMGLKGFIGKEFIPMIDRGELVVSVEMEPGAKIEKTNQITTWVEKILSTYPEVQKVLTNVGTSSEGLLSTPLSNNADLMITLCDKSQRKKSTEELGIEFKQKIAKMPGVKVRVAPVSFFGTANRSPIQILLTSSEPEKLKIAANLVENIVQTVPGTTDIRRSSQDAKPELGIEIDRQEMAQLGLSIFDVGNTLRIALTGDDDSKYREENTEYDIRIQLDQFDRSSTDEVGNFTFVNPKGQQIELKQFARVFQTIGPTKLEREKRIGSLTIYSQVFGRTSGDVKDDIDRMIKAAKLPDGVTYEFIGELKTMMDSFVSMFVALLAGILFVYMIMVALYDSYLYPFVVLFSIPVAIVGALYGLGFTMKSINIFTIMGLIMLVGLVAKNAILLVDRTNQMKKERGLSTYEALLEAGKTRLRPILMTTFAMIFGMMPIAISTGAGSEMKSGLGIVLIGGLTSSMFLSLVLVPVVYLIFDKSKARVFNFIKRFKSEEDIAEAEGVV